MERDEQPRAETITPASAAPAAITPTPAPAPTASAGGTPSLDDQALTLLNSGVDQEGLRAVVNAEGELDPAVLRHGDGSLRGLGMAGLTKRVAVMKRRGQLPPTFPDKPIKAVYVNRKGRPRNSPVAYRMEADLVAAFARALDRYGSGIA